MLGSGRGYRCPCTLVYPVTEGLPAACLGHSRKEPALRYPALRLAPQVAPQNHLGPWDVPHIKCFLLFQAERSSSPAPRQCLVAMSAAVTVSEGASREMEALCSELLLPTPGEVGAVGSPGVASTGLSGTPPLAASQDLLLGEASMPGEGAHSEGSNVEIFIEAVAGNVILSNAASATGMGCRERRMGPTALSRGREVWPWSLSQVPSGL